MNPLSGLRIRHVSSCQLTPLHLSTFVNVVSATKKMSVSWICHKRSWSRTLQQLRNIEEAETTTNKMHSEKKLRKEYKKWAIQSIKCNLKAG